MRRLLARGGLLWVLAGSWALLAGCNKTPLEPFELKEERATYGPLRVNPGNPRYFVDSRGEAVYLTGSNTWNTVQDWGDARPPPKFDNQAFLTLLEREHHNFTRLYMWEQAGGVAWTDTPVWFSPTLYLRAGSGVAQDGQPKFDLSRLNPEYFTRLRERVEQARDRGIYVSVMLFNGWSTGRKAAGMNEALQAQGLGNPWLHHPYNRENNVNGVDGDPGRTGDGISVHTREVPQITELQKAYVRQAIDTLNGYDNVLWEICNECDPGSEPWQYAMIEFIKSYEAGLPLQHVVGMTSVFPATSNASLYAGPADWISPAEVPGDTYKDDPPSQPGKVVIVDTDHLWGIGSDPAWVWKSVMRGLNPIFMDPMQAELIGNYPMFRKKPRAPDLRGQEMATMARSVRRDMGRARALLQQIDLKQSAPCDELVSSRYCLGRAGEGYMVFLPAPAYGWRGFVAGLRRGHFSERVVIDLSAEREPFQVQWFHVVTGDRVDGGTVEGGGKVELRAPFRGDAVALLRPAAGRPRHLTEGPRTHAGS